MGLTISHFAPFVNPCFFKFFVTVQDVQPNRPQVYAPLRSVLSESHWDSAPRALHVLSLHSQLLSEANGRSAHSKMKIHPIANEFA